MYRCVMYVLENMGMIIDTAVEDDGSRRILLLEMAMLTHDQIMVRLPRENNF